MLVSVQNQRLADWMHAESEPARKKRKSSAARAMARDRNVQDSQDDEMRRVLSAAAGLWQDGSGQGVVDVFAT